MTPRNLHGQKYAKDPFGKAGERQSDSNQEPPRKKPKTSVPKGSALASGYTDRAASRRDTEVPDIDVDNERKRLAALRDMLDTDQIDRATFNKLSYQIQGIWQLLQEAVLPANWWRMLCAWPSRWGDCVHREERGVLCAGFLLNIR